jgi:hypothetical protein
MIFHHQDDACLTIYPQMMELIPGLRTALSFERKQMPHACSLIWGLLMIKNLRRDPDVFPLIG